VIRRFAAFAAASVILAPLNVPTGLLPIPPYLITDVRAQLFYSRDGAFSENLVGSKKARSLWNTPIGEGGAGAASTATLIVVEVSGKPGSYAEDRSVELTVRGSKKELFRRKQELELLSDKGKVYLGFWLYDTGCDPLKVSARLIGQDNQSQRAIEIPFLCGE
jgi:hypothetical protein